jgi:hypothetical protein
VSLFHFSFLSLSFPEMNCIEEFKTREEIQERKKRKEKDNRGERRDNENKIK